MSVFAETYTSKYVGEENRKIKSLSPDDVEELKKGGGWGLAKAAECPCNFSCLLLVCTCLSY